MPTSRVIYQNEAVFAGPSNATGLFFSSGTSGNLIKQLYRVQTANRSSNTEREDINQLGQLARIGAMVTTPPTVSFDTSWYSTNVNNEVALGLSANNGASMISGILTKTTDDRNVFISRSPAGFDDLGYSGVNRIAQGIGNAFITNYQAEASVGGLATASVTMEGYNIVSYANASGNTPSLNPTNGARITGVPFVLPVTTSGFAGQNLAIRYGDISVDISNSTILGADVSDLKIQSYSLSIPLSREDINAFGTLYPTSRDLTVPINGTLSISAILGDSQTGSLSDVFCNDGDYNITITLRDPSCPGISGNVAVQYKIFGAKLDSETFNMSIGPAETSDFDFSFQMAGAQTTNQGVQLSGRLDS